MSRHGRSDPRRVYWYLGALALVIGAGVGVAVVLQGVAPASAPTASTEDTPRAGPVRSPAPVSPTPATAAPTTKPPTKPPPSRYVFPVVSGLASYAHTHHDYPATDIIAPCGSPVLAVTGGVILEVARTDTWKANTDLGADRGGLSFSLLGDDGVRYYGSHLRSIRAGIDAGVRVSAGQNVAVVGDTGDASACHLHFGISPGCDRTGDWWIRRGVIWPWPYLDSWRAGGAKSAVPEITAWSKVHGCPAAPTVDP